MNETTQEPVPSSDFFRSPTFLISTLLLANLITIIFFIISDGSIMQVLWSYWLQSLIIGVVHVVRIFLSTELSKIARIGTVLFFVFHYGTFHMGYMVFLLAFSFNLPTTINGTVTTLSLNTGISIASVLLSGLVFGIHHLFSFWRERQYMDSIHSPTPVVITWAAAQPYARILPMHITIIFGPILALKFGTNGIFILFMFLKTIVDLWLFRLGAGHPSIKRLR